MKKTTAKKIGLAKGCLASAMMLVFGVLVLIVPVLGWIIGPIMIIGSLGAWAHFKDQWEGPCPVCGKKVEVGTSGTCPACKSRIVREKNQFVCYG
jgi:hypothetical protein